MRWIHCERLSTPKNFGKWKHGECLALGGVAVCTNSADVGHTASVPADVITTNAILKAGMKKETHGCEPQGNAPELCQHSVCSRAALTPSEARGSQGSVQTGSSALLLAPGPPTLLCQPCTMPADSFKISNSRHSQPTQEKYSRALLFLLLRPTAHLDVSAEYLLL